jgi:hypothetical protein
LTAIPAIGLRMAPQVGSPGLASGLAEPNCEPYIGRIRSMDCPSGRKMPPTGGLPDSPGSELAWILRASEGASACDIAKVPVLQGQ